MDPDASHLAFPQGITDIQQTVYVNMQLSDKYIRYTNLIVITQIFGFFSQTGKG